MPPESLSRQCGVLKRVPMGRTKLREMVADGKFPSPIKIGRNNFWVISEIDAWIAARIAEGRSNG